MTRRAAQRRAHARAARDGDHARAALPLNLVRVRVGLANPNPNPNPNTGEVLQWAAEKFEARADDKWRSPQWRTAGNALTAALRPGFLLQSPAHLTPLTESGEQAA